MRLSTGCLVLVLIASTKAPAEDPPDGTSNWRVRLVQAEWTRTEETDFIRAAMRSSPARVRRLAARVAGRLRRASFREPLAALLGDETPAVRRAALFALGQIGGTETAAILKKQWKTQSPRDLPWSLEALAKCGDKENALLIAEALSNRNPHTRAAAALALGRLRHPPVLPILFQELPKQRLLATRWPFVYAAFMTLRQQARNQAGNADAKAVATPASWATSLESYLASNRPMPERVFAIRALGYLPDTEERLALLLEEEDPRILIAAIRSLRQNWNPDKAKRLLPLASHSRAVVREAVLGAVAAGKDRARILLVKIRKSMQEPEWLRTQWMVACAEAGWDAVPLRTEADRWRAGSKTGNFPEVPPTSEAAKSAFVELSTQESFPKDLARKHLPKLLRHKEFVVRAQAVQGLGIHGTAEHGSLIVAAARATLTPEKAIPEMDVRLEACRALAKLGAGRAWIEEAGKADPTPHVRRAARAALRTLDKKEAEEPQPPIVGLPLPGGRSVVERLAEADALAGSRLRLETTRGTLEIMLLPEDAPLHCVTFADLVRRKFFDGKTWHRVVGNFVVQGGCPRGDGWGGPGYLLPDELGPRPYVRGTVGMARSENDTGGSQLFVTHLPTPHLEGNYTIFGQVVTGFGVLDRIERDDRILRATIVPPEKEDE